MDILTQLQAAMDGRIVDRGGAITLRPGATHTPVFNLTDADIFWDQEKSWQPRLALSELYNYVTGVFVDKETIYQEKPFPPQRNVQYEKDDGGQRFEMQLGFAAITDWSQVQRITHRIHLASRLQGTIAFFLPLWALEAEQDDWFTITSARWNFNTKYFQIITSDLTMSPMPMVAIVARETAVTIDGWAPALNEVPRDDTFWIAPVGRVLPIPTIVATPITKTSTTEVVEQYGVSIVVTDLGDTPGTADSLELEIAPTADLAAAYNLGIYVSRDQTIEVYSLLANFAYSVRGRTYNGTQFSDWSPWSNFTTTASSIGYSVVVTPSLTLQANSDGSLNPAGQLPTSIVVDVVRGATSIKLDDTVDYAIIPTGCSASIDDTNGSATKGNIDLTNLSGWDGSIDVFVQVNGVALPSVRVVLSKTVAAGSGGSSGGGTGSKVAADNTLATITSSSDADITNVLTVTLAGGESLYGTGTISYNVRPLNTNVTDHLVAKWRYSPAGAGTWTDFPSSPIIGDDGYSGAPEDTPYNGSAVMTQTKSGLSAGDYDVKVVGHSNGGSTMHLGGTMKIEAKV